VIPYFASSRIGLSVRTLGALEAVLLTRTRALVAEAGTSRSHVARCFLVFDLFGARYSRSLHNRGRVGSR
jgi:hypothetical protein